MHVHFEIDQMSRITRSTLNMYNIPHVRRLYIARTCDSGQLPLSQQPTSRPLTRLYNGYFMFLYKFYVIKACRDTIINTHYPSWFQLSILLASLRMFWIKRTLKFLSYRVYTIKQLFIMECIEDVYIYFQAKSVIMFTR